PHTRQSRGRSRLVAEAAVGHAVDRRRARLERFDNEYRRWRNALGALRSGLDREVGIERLADFYHFLAGKTAGGSKLGDRFEVMVLPTRQAPAQHASRDAADVLEAVHDVARDEDDAAGTGFGGLIADCHLIEALGSILPGARYATKDVAGDRHMADGRKRQVSGHQRLAGRRQLPQKTDPDACRLLGVVFEAVVPVGVLEPDLEHEVPGERQPVAAGRQADHAVSGGVAAGATDDHPRRHLVLGLERPHPAVASAPRGGFARRQIRRGRAFVDHVRYRLALWQGRECESLRCFRRRGRAAFVDDDRVARSSVPAGTIWYSRTDRRCCTRCESRLAREGTGCRTWLRRASSRSPA